MDAHTSSSHPCNGCMDAHLAVACCCKRRRPWPVDASDDGMHFCQAASVDAHSNDCMCSWSIWCVCFGVLLFRLLCQPGRCMLEKVPKLLKKDGACMKKGLHYFSEAHGKATSGLHACTEGPFGTMHPLISHTASSSTPLPAGLEEGLVPIHTPGAYIVSSGHGWHAAA